MTYSFLVVIYFKNGEKVKIKDIINTIKEKISGKCEKCNDKPKKESQNNGDNPNNCNNNGNGNDNSECNDKYDSD